MKKKTRRNLIILNVVFIFLLVGLIYGRFSGLFSIIAPDTKQPYHPNIPLTSIISMASAGFGYLHPSSFPPNCEGTERFVTCKDDYWIASRSMGSFATWGDVGQNSDYSKIWISGGKYLPSVNLISVKDFKGNDIKISGIISNCAFSSYIGGEVCGKVFITYGGQQWVISGATSQSFELVSSRINFSNFAVSINGAEYKDYEVKGDTHIGISGPTDYYIDFNIPKYSVPFETCKLREGEMFAYNQFKGPTTVSEFSTRKVVSQFCINQPPTLLKADGGIEPIVELIFKFNRGETYNVESGDLLIIPYIWKNDGSITTPCNEKQILNRDNMNCEDIKGVTWFCDGVWDSSTHSCTVYAEIKYDCEGTLDMSITPPKCLVHMPEQIVCDDPNAIPDGINKVCYVKLPSTKVCPEGYTINELADRCEKFPLKEISCPINTAYNAVLDRCVGEKEVILENKTVIVQKVEYQTITAKESCEMEKGVWNEEEFVCKLTSPTLHLCEDAYGNKVNAKFVDNEYVCPTTTVDISQKEIMEGTVLQTRKVGTVNKTWIYVIVSLILIIIILSLILIMSKKKR